MTEKQIKQTAGYRFIPSVIKKERWENWDYYNRNAPPQESRERYVQLRKQMAYELWKAGVPLMTGSDSPEFFVVQGFSIHDELEMFVKSGLTPFASLQTATINPARYLGVDEQIGTIATGKQAVLLLLDKNPLEDIRNTEADQYSFYGKEMV
jgi:imidazolonepropionase-like amidohydrolase